MLIYYTQLIKKIIMSQDYFIAGNLLEVIPTSLPNSDNLKSILDAAIEHNCSEIFFPSDKKFTPHDASLLERHLERNLITKLHLDFDFYPISNKDHLLKVCGELKVEFTNSHVE